MIEYNKQIDKKFFEDPMQALAYWLGYDYKRYRFYDIREIAIANEMVHLLEANVKQAGSFLDCEVAYKNFSKGHQNNKHDQRADFAIWSPDKDNKKIKKYQAIIELKRLKTKKKKIEEDIERLHDVIKNTSNENLSCWLIAFTPGAIPDNWITEKQYATRKVLKTQNGSCYKIRRVVHAYPTFGPRPNEKNI